MLRIKLILIFVVFLVVSNSCRKDPILTENYTDILPERWKQFVGVYDVHHSVLNYDYQMEVKYLNSGFNSNGYPLDSLEILNYADQFNLKFEFRHHISIPSILSFVGYSEIEDQSGNRFFLSSSPASEVYQGFNVNTLYESDTMIVSGLINNWSFYQDDGIPFTSLDFNHVAVKQ